MHTSAITRIRKSKWTRVLTAFVCLNLLLEGLVPLVAMALTSGPTQPEVEGFQPVGITEMVDPFSGDFSYSIPLMDIGGYPLNLSYQSGISMDQEASWVGLGWNLHTGAITRQLRGLPDDFMGDGIVDKMGQKPNKTIVVKPSFGMELFGFEPKNEVQSNDSTGSINMSFGLSIVHNTYYGLDVGMDLGFGAGFNRAGSLPMNAGLGLSSNKDGLTLDPSFSLGNKGKGNETKASGKWSLGIGASLNSRKGLANVGLNASYSRSKQVCRDPKLRKGGNFANNQASNGEGTSSSTSFDLGTQSFLPDIQREYVTRSFTGTFKIGGATLQQDFSGKISVSGTVEKLKKNETTSPSFGYIYSEKANDNDQTLLDYNREKDGAFSTHHNNLPVTSFTYDVFNIAAQGLSGTFRAFRNDIGYVYDSRKISPSTSGSLGAELDLGNIVDLGLDFNLSAVNSESGPWKDDNGARGNLRFRGPESNAIKEHCHFRMMGERIPEVNPAFYTNELKGDHVAHFNMENSDGVIRLTNNLKAGDDPGDPSYGSINNNARTARQPRNTAVQTLTVSEVMKAYPHMRRYISSHAKPHHIGAVIVTDEQGKRYVFGLAAYNSHQVEKSFAVGGTLQNPAATQAIHPALNKAGLVIYGNADNLPNSFGIDNFYQATVTPAYAHSWMLTEILTPDYVDITGDGPTQDDLGAYVAFHYGIDQPGITNAPDLQDYGWRTPTTGTGQAGYMEGLRTDPTDDKANIVHGTKDIWYCHAIESKTHRAVFTLDPRLDAKGADENGFPQASALRAIREISLHSLDAPPGAPPIKTVHFEYDYSLCPNTPNSTAANKGKLTLKKVYFTYENSNAGKFSPYTFGYKLTDFNGNPFNYQYGESDRWGTFKPSYHNPGGMSNSDFPYAVQDLQNADDEAAAWSLNRITLPMGGEINVKYEADDYAYVQDRRAATMCTLAGFTGTSPLLNPQHNNLCYSPPGLNITASDSKQYVLFNIPTQTTNLTQAEFRERFLSDRPVRPGAPNQPMQYLYFRFLMNVNRTGDEKFEYVSGYAELEDPYIFGNCGMVSSNLGFVKVKLVQPTKDGSFLISPFAYAAEQFSRLYTPRYAYHQPQLDDSDLEGLAKTLASGFFVGPVLELFKGGVQKRMFKEGYGCKVNTQQSWLRLYDPDMKKTGGGLRVKRIEITDNWDDMAPQETAATYGQEFSYRNEDGSSSGVAAWEPAMGADENPMRLPVYNQEPKVKLVMDERFYIEKPVGESLFPSPSVGYSRVEVKDIVYNQAVTSRSTGKTVHEFYTARDFPVKLRETNVQPMTFRSDPILSLLSFNALNHANFSQGYTIELNDMHGKPRATRVYAEGATTPFAYTEHHFKLASDGSGLDSRIQVVNPDGSVTTREVGVDVDMVADFREQRTESQSGSLATNLNFGIAPPFPILGFSMFPGFKSSETRFRSSTVTKVIQRSGLQVETVSFDKGALLTTRTVALDAQTGNPIVQELDNEYKDKYYKTDYPAHWAYRGMAQASKNIGFVFGGPSFNPATGQIDNSLKPLLQPGDEVVTDQAMSMTGNVGSDNAFHYWVSQAANGNYFLINASGNPAVFAGAAPYFKVIRSGHRNLQNTSVGAVTSLDNPINNGVLAPNAADKVIACNAQTFREEWQTDLSVKKMIPATRCSDPNAMALMNILNDAINNGVFPVSPITNSNNLSSNVLPDFNQLFPNCSNNSSHLSVIFGLGAIQSYSGPANFPSSNYALQQGLSYPNASGTVREIETNCYCKAVFITSLADVTIFPQLDFYNIHHFNYVEEVIQNGLADYLILNATMNNGAIRKFMLTTNCWDFLPCGGEASFKCSALGDTINPYLAGILGNWHPWKSHVFQGNRNNTSTATAENLRTDGYLPGYIPFWTPVPTGIAPNPNINPTNYENWNWTNEMTIYSPYGFDLENRNPLGQYSAALYGYKNLLSIAVGNNARYKELAYDGFEDYYASYWQQGACPQPGSRFASAPSNISAAQAHTGLYSLKFNNTYARAFNTSPDPNNSIVPRAVPRVLTTPDLIQGFSPNNMPATKRFVVSFWTKAKLNLSPVFDYSDCISLNVKNGSTSYIVPNSLKTSKLVEGWQKLEYYIDIPAGSTGLTFEFSSTCGEAFIDDIRVHPYNSNMKAFVYNPFNFRFTAELDENNFATLYEYDQEGKLVRVQKETERGIMTIQETRTNLYKR